MTDAIRPADFAIREHLNHWEDFPEGREIVHATRRTVHDSDNDLFTASTLAFNPLYIDREAARADGHPDVVVNPMLVFCIVVGLTVEDLSEGGGPFASIADLRFVRSVYPDDTLSATSLVVSRRTTSRPDRGVITWRTTGRNQRGDVVVEFDRSNMWPLEPSA
jgi:itaconyl-CoA hydratase